jgi:hypothetical protein
MTTRCLRCVFMWHAVAVLATDVEQSQRHAIVTVPALPLRSVDRTVHMPNAHKCGSRQREIVMWSPQASAQRPFVDFNFSPL